MNKEDALYWNEILTIASQHHERVNGRGYPLGLSEKDLHPLSYTLILSDSWSAIRSTRAYDDSEKNLLNAVWRLKEGIEGSGSKNMKANLTRSMVKILFVS